MAITKISSYNIDSTATYTFGTVSATGAVSAAGNVTGSYIFGNGALLTGVITSVSNINNGTSNVTVTGSGANVTVGVGGTANVVVWATTGEYVTGVVSASGNITGSYLIGNGSQLTGLPAGYANANVATFMAAYGSNTISTTGNVTFGNTVANSLGVGTAATGTAGEIRATNNITGYYSSDAKFKENIRPIENALEIIEAIGGKLFDWTDSYIADHGGPDDYFMQKNDFGVIAQDVQKVFPMAIRKRPDGSLAVDYEKLSALAFAAIVELNAEIKLLKAK